MAVNQIVAQASDAATGKDKLEARLLSLCMNAGIPDTLLNLMGDNGPTSVSLVSNTFTDKDDLRDTFKAAPFDLGEQTCRLS